ncbi:MAG TPA: hypothetical protein VN914_17245 [Polyangia bacterium]|nr:hypothetical protein [Polyangia bacterium]
MVDGNGPTRRALLAGLGAAIALRGGSARAMCMPAPVFTAPRGGRLPPRPTIYWFRAKGGLTRLRIGKDGILIPVLEPLPRFAGNEGDRRTVPVDARIVASADGFDVVRIDVEADLAGPLRLETVNHAGANSRVADFEVDTGWRRPRTSTLLRRETLQRYSSCSGDDSHDLILDSAAPAFRVYWADTAEQVRARSCSNVIVPRSRECAWADDAAGLARCACEARVPLGYMSCSGSTFDWPDHAVFVGVAGLLPDGSEESLAGEPLRMEAPKRPGPDGGGPP